MTLERQDCFRLYGIGKPVILTAMACGACYGMLFSNVVRAREFLIAGPAGSGEFGSAVAVLPNGNIVVTDPGFDGVAGQNSGAAYLYGPDGPLLSTLSGATAGDAIGSGGITVLVGGNYLILSPNWHNGANANAGAVTFARAQTGVAGVVGIGNSLTGSSVDDAVGGRVVTLGNGNYLVRSPNWDNGAVGNAGAVTFGSGTAGVIGAVSSVNSLVGSTAFDKVGENPTVLANSNYVVGSPNWQNSSGMRVGAATWGSGVNGVHGPVTAGNSLIGSSAMDFIGIKIVALSNGNYVVASSAWNNGGLAAAGAVTFGPGATGIAGVVGPFNSLIGQTLGDNVGVIVNALSSGNYVVSSPKWDNGTIIDAGAATLCSGTSGRTGIVSSANSLVGSAPNDNVSSAGVTALSNGNYVVASPDWSRGTLDNAGAATFGLGSSGVTGPVTASNSLTGDTTNAEVGRNIVALSNGNYVVVSPSWNNNALMDVGAVTFGSGTLGVVGTVTLLNSLVGGTANDRIGTFGATALRNGNYVVASPDWDRGAMVDSGAATFGLGSGGLVGLITPSNSLLGVAANHRVADVVTALSNGNYVVRSGEWDIGTLPNIGAVTLGDGARGTYGEVLTSNSVHGSNPQDRIGEAVVALPDGNFVVDSAQWDNGSVINAGSVVLGSGEVAKNYLRGPIFAAEFAVRGTIADGGGAQNFSYDSTRKRLVVGQPRANRVTVLFSPLLFSGDFEGP